MRQRELSTVQYIIYLSIIYVLLLLFSEFGKRAAINCLPFSRLPQALLNTSQGLRVFVEPSFGDGNRPYRIEDELAKGIAIDVISCRAAKCLSQRKALLRVRLGKLRDQLEIGALEDGRG